MPYYTSFGAFQNELSTYYQTTGERIQFSEAIDSLYRKGLLSPARPEPAGLPVMLGHMDSASFEKIVDTITFPVRPSLVMSEDVDEEEIIPLLRDVFLIRHPRYTRPYLHRHDYVEIDYAVSGRFTLHFEDETRVLPEGSLCLIAPYSRHDIEITDESTVYCIMLRRSTFETTFFSLLSRDDALSLFFRTIFQENAKPNYLLFHAENREWMRTIVQNAMLECHKTDTYSNTCTISWIDLLFACLLRSASEAPQFYHYQMSADFSLVLTYIRNNYQDLTLSGLAEHFHYSKPHLCTLIKQNTGVSFTALIKRIRMSRAVEYLLHTDMKVSEIAAIVGYHSADHFSRVFRGVYDCSPQEYRRLHAARDGLFIPFEMV